MHSVNFSLLHITLLPVERPSKVEVHLERIVISYDPFFMTDSLHWETYVATRLYQRYF